MMTLEFIAALAIKSIVVAGVALLLLRVARRRSAAERSLAAHLGLVALVALPLGSLVLPSWNPVPIVAEAEPALPAISGVTRAVSEPATSTVQMRDKVGRALPDGEVIIAWSYAIPAILLLIMMLVAVVRLGAMHRRANVLVEPHWLSALAQAQRRMGFKHGTALLVSDELRSPVSWGMMRPIILLNPETIAARDEAEAIIAHELAHVARLDWAALLIARIACGLFWFNPLVWLLAREAHQLREEAADDAVLLSDVDDTAYASLLVNAARHDNRALLMAAHGVAPARNSLKRRVTRVLDRGLARRPANGPWIAVSLAILAGIAAPLAAFDPSAEAQTPQPQTDQPSQEASHRTTEVRQVSDEAETRTASEGPDDRDRERSEIDDLVAYKAVGMTEDYATRMRASGFDDASTENLIAAKANGVTPDYARWVLQQDPSSDLEDVIAAKAMGVTSAYVAEMRALFPGTDMEAISELAALGVDASYTREMRALFPGASEEDIVEMKAVGVTPAFVRRMRKEGISVHDPDEAVEGAIFLGRNDPKHRGSPPTAVAISAGRSGAAIAISPPPAQPPTPPATPD